MPPSTFSRRAVAALFLERQHLTRPRARRLTAKSALAFVEDAGGLQIDSINVIERGHYLTLWSRFGPFDRRKFDAIAYKKRMLFEYWAHAACLVSAAHFPAWRRVQLEYSLRSRAWGKWLRKNRTVLEAVEAAITAGGPMGSSDFEHRRKDGIRGGWWNWKPTSHALDYLWMSGRTIVHSRTNFQKRFDLAERLMPSLVVDEPMDLGAFRRWHLRQSLRGMGAATETDLRMYLTYPRTEAGVRRKVLAEAVALGEVVEVAVEGERGRWWALSADLPALAAAGRKRSGATGTTLLSPFDSFLWHRERTRRLFGFDYTLEVYTPGHKRVHGYYLLPIFHDGHLIGRLDPKVHRAEKRLEVKSVHFEEWFAKGKAPPAASWGVVDRDRALAGVAEGLRSLATFVGADDITVGRVVPGPLASPLHHQIKQPLLDS